MAILPVRPRAALAARCASHWEIVRVTDPGRGLADVGRDDEETGHEVLVPPHNGHGMVSLEEKLDLSESFRALKNSIVSATISTSTTNAVSFADMVKTSNKKEVRPINFSSVAIYPKDQSKSSEETKNLVQKMINPEEMKLHVRALRKVKNGGVIISTDSKDDIEKLKSTFKSTSPNLTIDEPLKRRPRIILLGVPSAMREQEVYSCLYEQNIVDKFPELTREEFIASIKLSHKSGKKDLETCNYIIEVPANIRRALISQNRAFINWSSCLVKDFTTLTRCLKCHFYGHAAKTCRQPELTCGHCSNLGHSDKECPNKAEDPKCATCSLFKKQSHHQTGDPDCPVRKMAERRYINSIDYGEI
ncbi:uncharacterized protein LOC125233535 [Leguminivora glycinivorella]|uniref:uncharacterized protein LOC125233535 n=1 Tax=Leguminivora glycinivorella TaxID=1035111 RepID=UPI00200F8EB8|nr:uncharacterized protein LOC125233535 [Leguminivora glycinivorella]